MKPLIVVDSQYGNTRKIAEALQSALPESRLLTVKEAAPSDLAGCDLLLVGSPTQGGQATQTLQSFLQQLPGLNGMKAAVFDTRIDAQKMNFALRLLMRTIGYAAPKIERALLAKGAVVIAAEGFIVEDKEGPLRPGEPERAGRWATELIKKTNG